MKLTASPDDQKSNHNGAQLSVNDLLKMMKASKPSRRMEVSVKPKVDVSFSHVLETISTIGCETCQVHIS
jgi:hypothetical protein